MKNEVLVMKKETIVIAFEAEKLRAVKKYMEKKEINFQEELAKEVERMYEKYVPNNVQEYINEGLEESRNVVKVKKEIKTQVIPKQ